MLGGKPVRGARVVVIDVESYHVGASLALRLAGQGHEVTIATPSEIVAAWCNWTLEGPRLREQLHADGRRDAERGRRPRRSCPAPCACSTRYGGAPFEVKADAVVLVTQRLSNEALYLELAGDADALAAAASRRSTAPATASPRAGSSTPSSTATAWRARSTARIRRVLPADPARARRSGHSAAAHVAHLRHRRCPQWQVGSTRCACAAAAGSPVVLIATAEARDDEMRERIEAHRRERPAAWRTVEEPLDLAGALRGLADGRVRDRRLPLALGLEPARARADGAAIEHLAAEAAALAAGRTGGLCRGVERGGHGNRPDERARALVPRRARARQRDLGRGRRRRRARGRRARAAAGASMSDVLDAALAAIAEPDAAAGAEVQRRLDEKTKPRGSLGGLERLAVQIASIQRTAAAVARQARRRRLRRRSRRRGRGRQCLPVVGHGADGRQLRRGRRRRERPGAPRRRPPRRRRLRRRRAAAGAGCARPPAGRRHGEHAARPGHVARAARSRRSRRASRSPRSSSTARAASRSARWASATPPPRPRSAARSRARRPSRPAVAARASTTRASRASATS